MTTTQRLSNALNWIFEHCAGDYTQYAFALSQMGWNRSEIGCELEVECSVDEDIVEKILEELF